MERLLSHRNYVIIGEAGSGKTELSLNLAARLAREGSLPVRFLDMDQTKPLFRSRDVGDTLRAMGITFEVQAQYADAPVVPYGVNETLLSPGLTAVLDVGGNQMGALSIGQFSQAIRASGALVLYTINPYRAFSDSSARIGETIGMILAGTGLSQVSVVANPYLGPGTTPTRLLEGVARLEELLIPLGRCIRATMVPEHLWESCQEQVPAPAIPIQSYLQQVLKLSAGGT